MPSLKSLGTPSRISKFEPLEERRLLAVSPAWLDTIGGPAINIFAYVAAHESGGVSVTGRFDGTVDFDPGPGVTELSSPGPLNDGNTNIAVARYSETGDLLWARRIGDDNPLHYHLDTGVATDRLGNTYALGIFKGWVQVASVAAGDDVDLILTGDGSDGFVAKYDPNGKFVWAQPLRATSSLIVPRDVEGLAVDDRDPNPANWSVFVGGVFNGTATLGGQTFRTSNTYDAFVSKLSASGGSFQWTRVIAGQGMQDPRSLSIAKTGSPALYVSGDYDTEAKFGSVTLTGPSDGHFLARLNPSDGSTVWAKTVPVSARADQALAAASDGVLIGGNLSGTADFDPGTGVVNLTSVGSSDAAILKLNASGNFQWARRIGGTGGASVQGLAVDGSGNAFLIGGFAGTAAFGSTTLTTHGINDGYMTELDASGNFLAAYQYDANNRQVSTDGAGNAYLSAQPNVSVNYFPTGDTTMFASAALMKFSPTAAPIDPTPSIHTFRAAPEKVLAGSPLTLSVTRIHDPAHQMQTVTFYRDNGDGVLNAADDVAVGTDVDPAGGWVATVPTTGLAAGTYTFFAQARAAGGAVLAEAATAADLVASEVSSYSSTNVPKAIPDKTTITSTLQAPDGFMIFDVDVTLNITHTSDADLDVYLISPAGTRVALLADVGGTGRNFTGTILDDEAATAIASGVAPFTGRFRPQGSLSAFDGEGAAGLWTLEVTDDLKKNTGILNSWSLQFTHEVMPIAAAARASLEAEGVAAAMLTTNAVMSANTSASMPLVVAAPASANQLAAVLTGNLSGEPANRLAARSTLLENDRDAVKQDAAAVDLALSALGDQLRRSSGFDDLG